MTEEISLYSLFVSAIVTPTSWIPGGMPWLKVAFIEVEERMVVSEARIVPPLRLTIACAPSTGKFRPYIIRSAPLMLALSS